MRDFRDLKVWSKAHALTLEIYRATVTFPPEERYGLTSQLRRSSASIPTNIAEGCGRYGDRELARFIAIAGGSASEVEYLLMLARDLDLLSQDAHGELHARVVEIKKMLTAFHRTLAG
jgi:four helix bundle protein